MLNSTSDPQPQNNGTEFPVKGRLLGVDFGTVRVGLAVCDPDWIVASPLATYKRRTEEKDIEYFQRVVKNESIVARVVGLPISLDCTEGPKAKEAREYGAWLVKTTGLPIEFWDERFTTAIAEDAMMDAGLTQQKRKERRDRVAAQIMLQAFLGSRTKPRYTGGLEFSIVAFLSRSMSVNSVDSTAFLKSASPSHRYWLSPRT